MEKWLYALAAIYVFIIYGFIFLSAVFNNAASAEIAPWIFGKMAEIAWLLPLLSGIANLTAVLTIGKKVNKKCLFDWLNRSCNSCGGGLHIPSGKRAIFHWLSGKILEREKPQAASFDLRHDSSILFCRGRNFYDGAFASGKPLEKIDHSSACSFCFIDFGCDGNGDHQDIIHIIGNVPGIALIKNAQKWLTKYEIHHIIFLAGFKKKLVDFVSFSMGILDKQIV